MELDNLDIKIIYELDKNSRQSAAEIGKKLRTHKSVINFRINRLVKNEVIREFVTMISPSALGLTPYKFYLQIQNLTTEKEAEIFNFVKTIPTYWASKTSGNWDIIIGILTKDTNELNQIKNLILKKFGNDIIKKSISILTQAPHYNRKYLSQTNEIKEQNWISQTPKQEIDNLDKTILKKLANNARTPIIDIAEKAGKTVKTIMSRIKQLEKKKIIYDYRISLNLQKINMKFFKCFITLKNTNELSQIKQYCKGHKNIIHLIESVGEWDLEPEFEIESEENFFTTIQEMRNKFKSMKTIETINILKEYSYTCIP